MSYPYPPGYPQYQVPSPSYPRPPKTSTKGPRWMTLIGVFLLLVTAAAAVGIWLTFRQTVNEVHVLARDGSPSSDVILAVGPGQSGEVRLDGDTRYGIWMTGRAETSHGADECPMWRERPKMTGPGQSSVFLSSVSGNLQTRMGDRCARYQWEFTTSTAGTYQVTAPDDGTVMVTQTADVGAFVGGVWLGIVLVLIAGGAALPGLGLTIGGAIWWHTRRKAARRVGSV